MLGGHCLLKAMLRVFMFLSVLGRISQAAGDNKVCSRLLIRRQYPTTGADGEYMLTGRTCVPGNPSYGVYEKVLPAGEGPNYLYRAQKGTWLLFKTACQLTNYGETAATPYPWESNFLNNGIAYPGTEITCLANKEELTIPVGTETGSWVLPAVSRNQQRLTYQLDMQLPDAASQLSLNIEAQGWNCDNTVLNVNVTDQRPQAMTHQLCSHFEYTHGKVYQNIYTDKFVLLRLRAEELAVTTTNQPTFVLRYRIAYFPAVTMTPLQSTTEMDVTGGEEDLESYTAMDYYDLLGEPTTPGEMIPPPQKEKTTTQQTNTTPEHKTTTIQKENTTPQQESTTPQQENATPQQENATPRQENTTPQQENATQQQENTTQQQENTTPQQENTTPQQENTTPLHEQTPIPPRNASPTTVDKSVWTEGAPGAPRVTTGDWDPGDESGDGKYPGDRYTTRPPFVEVPDPCPGFPCDDITMCECPCWSVDYCDSQLDNPDQRVCATNGLTTSTYDSRCHAHAFNCDADVSIVHSGPCQKMPTAADTVAPVTEITRVTARYEEPISRPSIQPPLGGLVLIIIVVICGLVLLAIIITVTIVCVKRRRKHGHVALWPSAPEDANLIAKNDAKTQRSTSRPEGRGLPRNSRPFSRSSQSSFRASPKSYRKSSSDNSDPERASLAGCIVPIEQSVDTNPSTFMAALNGDCTAQNGHIGNVLPTLTPTLPNSDGNGSIDVVLRPEPPERQGSVTESKVYEIQLESGVGVDFDVLSEVDAVFDDSHLATRL